MVITCVALVLLGVMFGRSWVGSRTIDLTNAVKLVHGRLRVSEVQ